MELLPPASHGGDRSKLPRGNMLGISRFQVSKLRKVYGKLPAGELAELKASALETGEPLTRARAYAR